jgi:hypothetical protein
MVLAGIAIGCVHARMAGHIDFAGAYFLFAGLCDQSSAALNWLSGLFVEIFWVYNL